jgi:hypothetical protein
LCFDHDESSSGDVFSKLEVTTDIYAVISFSDLRAILKLYRSWEPLLLDLEKTLQPRGGGEKVPPSPKVIRDDARTGAGQRERLEGAKRTPETGKRLSRASGKGKEPEARSASQSEELKDKEGEAIIKDDEETSLRDADEEQVALEDSIIDEERRELMDELRDIELEDDEEEGGGDELLGLDELSDESVHASDRPLVEEEEKFEIAGYWEKPPLEAGKTEEELMDERRRLRRVSGKRTHYDTVTKFADSFVKRNSKYDIIEDYRNVVEDSPSPLPSTSSTAPTTGTSTTTTTTTTTTATGTLGKVEKPLDDLEDDFVVIGDTSSPIVTIQAPPVSTPSQPLLPPPHPPSLFFLHPSSSSTSTTSPPPSCSSSSPPASIPVASPLLPRSPPPSLLSIPSPLPSAPDSSHPETKRTSKSDPEGQGHRGEGPQGDRHRIQRYGAEHVEEGDREEGSESHCIFFFFLFYFIYFLEFFCKICSIFPFLSPPPSLSNTSPSSKSPSRTSSCKFWMTPILPISVFLL